MSKQNDHFKIYVQISVMRGLLWKEPNKYLPVSISISEFLWYLDWSKVQYLESNVCICIQSKIEINQIFLGGSFGCLIENQVRVSFCWEKGSRKKSSETYWAYYGKYACPSIQNTETICKVYVTENMWWNISNLLLSIKKNSIQNWVLWFPETYFPDQSVGEYFALKKLSFGKIYEGI